MDAAPIAKMLQSRGITLTASGDNLIVDHHGEMTDADRDAIRTHKAALLVLLARADDRTGPAGPPVSETPGPVGSDGPAPPPADRRWRGAVARWPVDWRELWGRRANELEDRGEPWDRAEWIACGELAPDLADAECRGEVVCADPPAGLSDREAVEAINWAFADPAPARWSDRRKSDDGKNHESGGEST